MRGMMGTPMHRLPLACGLVVVVATITGASARAWTASQDLPDGPGKDTMVRLCRACHPMDRVVAARHSNKEWIAIVEKMLTQGAEGKEEEFNEAIDYLTDQYGKPVAMNTATAAEIDAALGIGEDEAKAIVAYRTGHPPFVSWKDVAAVPGVEAVWIERRQKNLTFGSVTVPPR
jgi:competence ComEA-like helix-hairpin-helix protein